MQPSLTITPAFITLGLLTLVANTGCQTPPKQKPPQVNWSDITFVEEFTLDELGDVWTMRTPELWQIATETGTADSPERRFLKLLPLPQPETPTPNARPHEYVIYTQNTFRSFNLSCRVRLHPNSNSQSNACIIFGRQDSAHMYVFTLSSQADAVHNNIISVNGDMNHSLVKSNSEAPIINDQQWHKVDVIREATTGLIRIYVDAYDENAQPTFEVYDKTYTSGSLGVGSLYGPADFGRIIIEGESHATRSAH